MFLFQWNQPKQPSNVKNQLKRIPVELFRMADEGIVVLERQALLALLADDFDCERRDSMRDRSWYYPQTSNKITAQCLSWWQ